MAWQDDIQQVLYTSPSGQQFTFQYEGLSVTTNKKTAEFEFAEKDGVYIQDLGISGRSFPFTLFFTGDDYNTQADAFLLALEEKGIGKLEHPLYGNRDVVPTGSITRNDSLVSEANQASFSVTFSETIKDVFFPSNTIDAQSEISESLDDFQATAAVKFSESIEQDSIGDSINLGLRMSSQLTAFNDKVKNIIAISESIKAQYEQVKTSYENAIDDVFNNAETVARQGIELIRIPAKVNTDIKSKIKVFNDATTEIFADFARAISKNNFFETNKNIMAYNTAACETVLDYEFSTRNEAIEVSETILTMYDTIKDFQDDYIGTLSIIDTGEDYQALSDLIAKVTGYLISISFDLPSEKTVVLGKDRNVIELCKELYGTIDQLDYFIETNDFTCDEIELLETGKSVVYYE